jgi:serine/threonine protein kinase
MLQGGDLRKAWLRNEGLYAWGARGRDIALDIARGLRFLHSKGIIHR